MTKHTPTPWKVNRRLKRFCIDAETQDIASMAEYLPNAEANAAFIIRACNAHEDLVEVLVDMTRLVCKCQDVLSLYLQPKGNMRDAIMALLGLLDGPEQREIQGRVISALAKAKGE